MTDNCSPAEPATSALQMQQTNQDKLHVQNNVEISADSAGEPETSASIQRDDKKQTNAGNPLTSGKSESQTQPATLTETETLPETDDTAEV